MPSLTDHERRWGGMATTAYCVKCREKREMTNEQAVKMKNGKDATKGTCPVCGCGMYKIGKAAA